MKKMYAMILCIYICGGTIVCKLGGGYIFQTKLVIVESRQQKSSFEFDTVIDAFVGRTYQRRPKAAQAGDMDSNTI
jgi:hypothetical protein